MAKRLLTFLREDIWRVRSRALPRRQLWLFRPLRIILLALRGFDEDVCQLRASALTFFSLLSIVPVLAMVFGVAKGFGLQTHLEEVLTQRLQGQEQVLQWLIQFANTFLESTKGGLVAGVGVVLLFWTVIKVLGNIEASFNAVWGVRVGRPMARKFSDYLSIMLIAPVLLLVASGATVFLASQMTQLAERLTSLGMLSGFLMLAVTALPYVVLWVLLTFLYMFLPNTRVSLRAGVTAGVVAGTIYQMVQWVYLYFQIGVSRFNAVYGGFAALPLFLIWVQVSWLIVLFGAEVSFAVDNEETYEFERDCANASLRFKRLLALKLTELCVKRFDQGQPPLDASALVHQLEAPVRLVRELLFELVASGILISVKQDGAVGEWYQPAQPVDRLTIRTVLDALECRGQDNPAMVNGKELERVGQTLEALDRLARTASDNVLLRDF